MAQKGLWNLAREKTLQDRGALSKEEGDVVREYKARREEHFLGSLLKEVGEDKKEVVLEADRETEIEVSKKRPREEEKEENETVMVKRRRINYVIARGL